MSRVDMTTNMGTAAYMAPELSNIKKYTLDYSRDSLDLELVRNQLLVGSNFCSDSNDTQ